jgi:hypothetical protein
MDANKQTPQSENTRPAEAKPGTPPGDRASTQERIQEILRRARAGDKSVLPELEGLLDANPKYWENAGDLVKATEQMWIERISATDLVFGQSLRRHVERWKRELADQAGSPLERILAARIVVTWLAAQHAELLEAASKDEGTKVAELQIRRAEAANRRFLAAAKTLATVRRLIGGLRVEIHHHADQATNDGQPGPAREQLREALAAGTAVDRRLVGVS